ncbi:hypothetical protein MLD38_031087 [Melastoma candidum]|uniref:Uncharacterized protein n=1 Tax=Melastoma candidum TaxID=119954 RepID=A0ACB9MPS7_9MYRT|nr:hypothetical protein MLD38_031087 [Melastoma candidum]
MTHLIRLFELRSVSPVSSPLDGGAVLPQVFPLCLNERLPSMPLFEVATAHPNFQNHLGALRSQALTNGRLLPSSYSLGNSKAFSPLWTPSGIRKKTRFEIRPAKLTVEAVASLELKCSDLRKHVGTSLDDSPPGTKSSPVGSHLSSSEGDDDLAVGEREKLRRKRISKANKGNTPWNKGRKHSAETLQRIRERTRIAMQDPKVRMKLSKLGHAQTDETKLKISAGVRMGWERRRQLQLVQETCYFKWQNLIAEASRRGYSGEDELHWDSYEILNGQLEQEWIETVEQRKALPRPKGCRRAPKSPEQRRKIAEAILAKWADPEYRDRVRSGLAKFHGTVDGGERKPRRSPGSITRPRQNSLPKKPRELGNALKRDPADRRAKLRKSNGPLFKDPQARSKLEMIKSIRAQRAASETNKVEAIERATLLIGEAERAALALEVVATKSPVARASLIETRKLIAEAIHSLESVETDFEWTSSKEDGTCPSCPTLVPAIHDEGGVTGSSSIDPTWMKLNGTATGVNGWKSEFDFGKFSLQQLLEASDEILSTSREATANQQELLRTATLGGDERLPRPNSEEHAGLTSTATLMKKWVRGRLVEVDD